MTAFRVKARKENYFFSVLCFNIFSKEQRLFKLVLLLSSSQPSSLYQGCAIFFSGGPNTNKHNILRAASSNKIIFYQISKTILPVIKIKPQ